MNYIPGDYIRRAAANVTSISSTVSGAVSSVAQVASGGKKKHDGGDGMLHNAKEKYSLMLKCTPNKDAATTANLAVKSGFLLKRNEQGNWQKRFVCIVPHMFLYYFDNELADSPRGTIDLELYTEVYREDGMLRLGTVDEEILRSFYFDDDDKDNLNDWSSSLTRDRYHTVREERNAYQQMQFEMTGAIDDASKRHKDTLRERELLEQRLFQAEQYCASAKNALQSVLVEFGVTDEEMGNLSEINRIGVSLKQRINDMRHSHDTRIDELFEELKAEKADREKDVIEANKKLEQEQQARKNLEALIIKERKESEKKIKETESQVDNITMNFQMAVAGKSTAEAKSNTLSEQKKLLVKEVKQLRKKLEDCNNSIEDLKTMNDRLVKAAQVLQMKLKTTTAAASTEPSTPQSAEVGDASPLEGKTEEAVEDMEQEDIDMLLRQSGEFSASLIASTPVEGSIHDSTEHNTIPDDDRHDQPDVRKLSNSTNNEEEERMSWDMPQMQLKELGWLTEEQSKMMEKRMAMTEKGNHAAGSRTASPVPVAGGLKQSQADDVLKDHDHHASNGQKKGNSLSLFSSVLGTAGADSLEAPHHSTAEPQTNRRSSLSMISSMFGSKTSTPSSGKKEDHPIDQQSEVHSKPIFPSALDEEDSSDERLPSAMRLQCLRCKGTVEGPKFSTCKCAIPALTPDDLNTHSHGGTLNMLSGMFSKSTSVAGGLAGGLMKATAATAGLVSYSTHSHTSSLQQNVATSEHNHNDNASREDIQ